MKSLKRITVLGCMLISGLPLHACAIDYGNQPPPAQEEPKHSITIDDTGAIVVRDARGKPIKGEEVQFPVKAEAIEEIETLTIVRARGSHFKVICNSNNNCTKYRFPH